MSGPAPESRDTAHHDSGPAHGHAPGGFLRTYVFSTDHKMIGKQFLFTTLFFLLVGGALALGVRWMLAWPGAALPWGLGRLFNESGVPGYEHYNMMFTMHASVMIFLVIIPMLNGAFANFLIPLQIGADDMAFPRLNMLSYWFMWPAARPRRGGPPTPPSATSSAPSPRSWDRPSGPWACSSSASPPSWGPSTTPRPSSRCAPRG